MALSTKTAGLLVLTLSFASFAYLSVWLLVLPFLDQAQPLRQFFPDQTVAFTLLSLGFVTFTATLGLSIAYSFLFP